LVDAWCHFGLGGELLEVDSQIGKDC
jgi:hypothetical protein